MKVLALNGSPRMKTSSTWHMLEPLLKGMEEAGAETDAVHIRQLNLNPCIGCYTCWVRTPGKCIHDDPMDEVLKKFRSADLIVYGTPLYHFSMSGILKTFIDRTLPLMEPWLVPHSTVEGVTGHPVRDQHRAKMMLVSPCGFPEFEHFESLVATFRHIARMEGIEYIGEILRPFAEALSRNQLQFLFAEYYSTLRKAGREIIENGRIADSTLTELRKDLFPGGKEVLYNLSDDYWKRQMDRFNVPEEKRHLVELDADRRPIPMLQRDIEATPLFPVRGSASKTLDTEPNESQIPNRLIAEAMADMYRPEAIPNLRATIQLHLIGSAKNSNAGPADWLIDLRPTGAAVEMGHTPFPTLAISTPNQVWHDIGRGKIEPEHAFVEGLFEADGDFNLLRRFPEIFAYPRAKTAEKTITDSQREDLPLDLETMPISVLFTGMAAKYNGDVGGEMTAVIQFELSGEEPGQHYIIVEDGKATYHEGAAESPNLTIQTPSRIWRQVSSGDMDGATAFAKGLYKVTGDFSLLIRMSELFSG